MATPLWGMWNRSPGCVWDLGTLYGAISRLERDGLIEPLPGDERRRPYRLTAVGQQHLESALADLRTLTQTAEGRLAS
ncbi:MAG: PadR family transcriptional regulator [Chloroflexota bacterium]